MNIATEKKRENVNVLLNENCLGHLMMNYSKSFNKYAYCNLYFCKK